jgi:hypothetical protein
MKHIKKLNEYQRTVGFRYSQPNEKFNIKVYLDSELKKEEIETSLNEIDVIFGNIKFEDVPEDYVTQEENEVVVSVVTFELSIFNEKELEKILEDFSKIINLDYGVRVLEFFIKPKRESKRLDESKKEFDVYFFQDVFLEFLDKSEVEFEWIEGSMFSLYIPLKQLPEQFDEDRTIEDYVSAANKIKETMDNIQVAINRIKDEYGDKTKIQLEIDRHTSEKSWFNIHIIPK